ncbi:MAG: hypothetical protein R2795_01115 [Saprospiraceae bacterium]
MPSGKMGSAIFVKMLREKMKNNKTLNTRLVKIILFIFLFILGIGIRNWFGIYMHDEFGEKYLFMKHRSTWKWKFYSPIGQSDLTLNDLDSLSKSEELMFGEFIRQQGLSK